MSNGIWVCGSNSAGQLGTGHTKDVGSYTFVPLPVAVDAVCGGGNHTVVVGGGRAFASGANGENQLGLPQVGAASRFAEIVHPCGSRWAKAAAGWAFTVLVDEHDDIWVAGSGRHGELGELRDAPKFARIANLGPVAVVECGLAHTVVLLESGAVYGWGRNRQGQLGSGIGDVVRMPVQIGEAAGVACGRDFTVLTTARAGMSSGPPPARPRGIVEIQGPAVVHAGWTTVYTLRDGVVTGFGNNSHGQCAPHVVDAYAAGSEHCVGVTGECVKAWGWGEHGNCATACGDVHSVFAGCATSFVVGFLR